MRPSATANVKFRTILGINFFTGNAAEAVDRMQQGGLLVVPAAPALKNLPHDPEYRAALLHADLVITDSAFMVMLWNFLQQDSLRRVSGLAYMNELVRRMKGRHDIEMFWIMPSAAGATTNILWLKTQGVNVRDEDCYVAPIYGPQFEDPSLVQRLNDRRPKHIVIALGGGTQERLGLYLKRSLGYDAAIHCIGAAIAFLSGDQVRIPTWADRVYLGWLFRCIAQPRRFVPRYWDARHLMSLLLEYRERLPKVVT